VKLPDDDDARLEVVGVALLGKSYRRGLARVCGVSNALVYAWRPNEKGLLNEYLLAAVQSERVGVRQRDKVLTEIHSALRRLPGHGQ
jgi:hypothetical protein